MKKSLLNFIQLRRAFCSKSNGPSSKVGDPAAAQIRIDDAMVAKLERLSALRMTEQDRRNLEEDIQLAQHILEVDTEDVKPLYNIAEDHMDCPLREDVPEPTSAKETLMNARKSFEGFFVAPTVGVVDKRKKKDGGRGDDDKRKSDI